MLAAPAALLLASPAGADRRPATWAVLVVAVATAVCAVRPDGPAGPVALIGVIAWWAWSVPDVSAWALPAAGFLVAGHCAALVAAHGPGDLAPDRRVLGLWARRAALLALVAVPVWAAASLLEQGAGDGPWWTWPVAAVTVGVVGLVAVARAAEVRS